jgi:hypothetical protein
VTLREAARRLQAIATEVRDVAGRVDGPEPVRWAAARDLRSTAFNLESHAVIAERKGIEAGEPDPDDLSWLVTAAPGEITEVMGR